jgi:hypothetical protein
MVSNEVPNDNIERGSGILLAVDCLADKRDRIAVQELRRMIEPNQRVGSAASAGAG